MKTILFVALPPVPRRQRAVDGLLRAGAVAALGPGVQRHHGRRVVEAALRTAEVQVPERKDAREYIDNCSRVRN